MKLRGRKPNPSHPRIKKLLEEGKKPAAIIIAVGCTIWAVRYVRGKMKKRKSKKIIY